MADPELVKVLDYILNRCGAAEIEAVAAAVVRRRRDIALFGELGKLDPARFARKAAEELSGSVGASLESVRSTVRDMAERMVRKEAPELGDEEVAELLDAWVGSGPPPNGAVEAGSSQSAGSGDGPRSRLPPDVAIAMVRQFVAYSQGSMPKAEAASLRSELGDWPARYWNAFPSVLRSIVSDYLKGELSDGDFERALIAAAEL